MKPVRLQGEVARFRGMGRQLGYPTANIHTGTSLDDGVYFGWANLGQFRHQPAMIFVGTPTTVGDTVRRVEAHLLDVPDQDYYDLELTLEVAHFQRANETFDGVPELLEAMTADEAAARQWFVQETLAPAKKKEDAGG